MSFRLVDIVELGRCFPKNIAYEIGARLELLSVELDRADKMLADGKRDESKSLFLESLGILFSDSAVKTYMVSMFSSSCSWHGKILLKYKGFKAHVRF